MKAIESYRYAHVRFSKMSRFVHTALAWADDLRDGSKETDLKLTSKKSVGKKYEKWIRLLNIEIPDSKAYSHLSFLCPRSVGVAQEIMKDMRDDYVEGNVTKQKEYASRIRLLAHDIEGEAYRNAYTYWTSIEARRLGRIHSKIR